VIPRRRSHHRSRSPAGEPSQSFLAAAPGMTSITNSRRAGGFAEHNTDTARVPVLVGVKLYREQDQTANAFCLFASTLVEEREDAFSFCRVGVGYPHKTAA